MRPMKDSGIAWIGKIPQNFEVIKNHYLITCIKGKNPNDLNNEGIGFPYIGASDLDSNNYSIYTTDSSLPSVDSNDVLILWDGARAGLVGIGKIGKLSSTLVKLQFVEKINSRYFYWYLLGMSSFITSCVNGTTIPHMSRKYIDDICFITFPLPEQQAIADKLDRVCGEIDNVITKTKAVVEEYKKLKQAIITEAVTGVASLQPTAISQQGSVKSDVTRPLSKRWQGGFANTDKEKWAEIKLKYLFHIEKRIAGKEGYTVLSITQKGIKQKDLSKNEGQLAENYSSYQFLHPGEFAMNHMDLLTGWVDISQYDGVTSPDYRVFVSDSDKCNKRFYLYFFQMCYFDKVFYRLGQGVSGMGRWRLQTDKFLNFIIPFPPLAEQQAIVAYLDAKCGAIDELIAKKQQLIREMENYKKSVIYEYVTGKREVG